VSGTSPLQPRIRTIGGEIVVVVGFLVFIVLVFAETEQVGRPVTAEWFWPLATLWGIRLAYDHRHTGPLVMLAWGVATAIGTAASFAGLLLVAHAIGPSVRAQAWLPPVLIGLAVTAVLAVLVRRFLRESTTDGRAIAVGEDLALCLVPLGLALATQGELLFPVGGGLALSGPVIMYRLGAERRRRGLATD
jgi:hypothetical protein